MLAMGFLWSVGETISSLPLVNLRTGFWSGIGRANCVKKASAGKGAISSFSICTHTWASLSAILFLDSCESEKDQ